MLLFYWQDSIMSDYVWEIAVFRPLRKCLDYLPPVDLNIIPEPGARVKVPMGSKDICGIFLGYKAHSLVDKGKLRPVRQVLDEKPLLSSHLLDLCRWASQYYHHPLGEVLSLSLPILLRQGREAEIIYENVWQLTEIGQNIDLNSLKKAPRQAQTLSLTQQQGQLTRQMIKDYQLPDSAVKHLQTKGWLKKQRLSPLTPPNPSAKQRVELNQAQQQAFAAMAVHLGHFQTCLLHGVTGSGKTEVYLQLIAEVLKRQQQVLVLIPEISLTPQTLRRFEEALNVPIATFHSHLTQRQRLNHWLTAHNNEARIIIGTRSAIFTPLPKLGLIILDEEHDPSFKQQEGFRYSARDLAIKRGQLQNVPIILGSATPSLETLYNCQIKKFQYFSLPSRVGQATLPSIQIIDIRQKQLHEGLSEPLLPHIEKHLQQQGQVLIFLNQRGFSPCVICHQCGWIANCGHCDSHLVYHQHNNRLICHHCGRQQPCMQYCLKCQVGKLTCLGAGTERIEQALHQHFHDYPIIRVDRDSTRKKGTLEAKLASITQGHSQILIGTQMLAKGHHFPNMTLVAVIDADSGFLSADLKAAERMGQLLVQVSGRAGRGDKKGEVIIQTRHPQNPALITLIEKGYTAFAKMLLHQRQQSQLPPYSYLALLRAEALSEAMVFKFLNQARTYLPSSDTHVDIMGPVPAPMARKAGKWRGQLLLQTSTWKQRHVLLDHLIAHISQLKTSYQLKWSIDVDPYDLL
jgi:primosomal protein N' (replication factor Y)